MKLSKFGFVLCASLASTASLAEFGIYSKIDDCVLNYDVTDRKGLTKSGDGYINIKTISGITTDSEDIKITAGMNVVTLRRVPAKDQKTILSKFSSCNK
jgi:hypothetical protein